jgi:type VI secretion system secreted protein Hcp
MSLGQQPLVFLALDGIPGPSLDAKHKGAIELLSFSVGAHSSNGTPRVEQANCMAVASSVVPKLWKAFFERTDIKQAAVTMRAAGSEALEYCTYTLSNCKVTAITDTAPKQAAEAGPHNGAMPSDICNFALAYSKIDIQVQEIKADGTLGAPVKYGRDLMANK